MNISATRLVTAIVGLLGLVSVVGIIALAWAARPVPDVLQNIAVGALTGLVGLLVPTRNDGA